LLVVFDTVFDWVEVQTHTLGEVVLVILEEIFVTSTFQTFNETMSQKIIIYLFTGLDLTNWITESLIVIFDHLITRITLLTNEFTIVDVTLVDLTRFTLIILQEVI
jgi:hypothetical protein